MWLVFFEARNKFVNIAAKDRAKKDGNRFIMLFNAWGSGHGKPGARQ